MAEQKDLQDSENTVLEHNRFNVQPQLFNYRESVTLASVQLSPWCNLTFLFAPSVVVGSGGRPGYLSPVVNHLHGERIFM